MLADTAFSDIDTSYMQIALACADYGGRQGEVPVGAVMVYQGKMIATGYNQPINQQDATAHAEIMAIRAACQYFNNYRLPLGCELFVTLEPCTMCLGAIIHARVSRLIFAATEPKAGMIVSQQQFSEQHFYNHHLAVQSGLLAEESRTLLQSFFKARRQAKKQKSIIL